MLGGGVIVVLCGLPGCGKSHLAKQLQDKLNYGHLKLSSTDEENLGHANCIVIEYDHLLPPSLEKELIANNKNQQSKNYSEWKAYRQDIIKTVDELMASLSGEQKSDIDALIKAPRIAQLDQHIRQQNSNSLPTDRNNAKFVIVIDDNMYLESMRHPYFQLARKYNYGFCQIHLKCDWHRQRNESREVKVNEQTMEGMAQKFEAPSHESKQTLRHSFNCTIANNNDHYQSCWEQLESLLKKSFDNPITKEEDVTEIRALSREICLKNVIHTADQLLRVVISESMAEEKSTLHKAQMQERGKELNRGRFEILDGIKKGQITIPESIAEEIKNGNAASVNSNFKKFLKSQMDSGLS